MNEHSRALPNVGRAFPSSGAAGVSDSSSPSDRKSTRLNSSHANISYFVFCLKKSMTYSLDDVVDELLGLVDLLLCVRHNQAVQIFLLVAGVSCVRPSFTLFHGALAANRNLCAGLSFYFIEGVPTRSNTYSNR